MTLCIAAHAKSGMSPRIILCCDWMVGDDFSQSESVDKMNDTFAPGLVSMFSGLVDEANNLKQICSKHIDGRRLDRNDTKFALYTAYKEVMENAELLNSRWPDVDLLVCGFLQSGPSIFHINYEGVREISPPGVGVIGIGAFYADPLLRWRLVNEPLDPFDNIHDVLYRVYESKRFAETSKHVGKLTTLAVMQPPSNLQEEYFTLALVPPPWLGFLSEQFQKFGPARLPKQREYFRESPEVIGYPSGHSGGNP
jgi:hypothetical protein